MVLWWFGANMAGQRNKNAFKFLLILLILSQKHILGVKTVVWDGLDVVWRWFGVFPRTLYLTQDIASLTQNRALDQQKVIMCVLWDSQKM